MSTAKERLKDSQRGQGSNIPRLNIVKQLEIRDYEGKPAFHWFDTSTKPGTDVYTTESFGGVYVNSAQRITAFDRNLGVKGGSYFSTYYFSNQDIVVLMAQNVRGGVDKIMSGTPVAIKEYIVSHFPGVQPKVSKILFVLNTDGLYAIKTNISLAIDQFNRLQDEFGERMMILTPTEYDPADADISKMCKEKHLGPLADKNRPKYAKITLGPEISDEMLEELGIDDVLANFKAWREYKGTNPATDDDKNTNVVEGAASGRGPQPMPDDIHSDKPGSGSDELPY